MVDLVVSIIIPSAILMKLSGAENLGAVNALILALAFPIGWGLYELTKFKQINWVSVLGLISVLLTGGIGLFQLDTQWLAIKEAAVPSIIAMVILGSLFTPYPLIKTLFYNPKFIDVNKIQNQLNKRNNQALFDRQLTKATYFLCATFLFSAVMNYILATKIVTSPTGSAPFNEELGQLTLISYPVIAIPSMLMMLAIFYFLKQSIYKMTGLTLTEIWTAKNTHS